MRRTTEKEGPARAIPNGFVPFAAKRGTGETGSSHLGNPITLDRLVPDCLQDLTVRATRQALRSVQRHPVQRRRQTATAAGVASDRLRRVLG